MTTIKNANRRIDDAGAKKGKMGTKGNGRKKEAMATSTKEKDNNPRQ